jgi:L-malate glycosyltransferase
MTNNALNILLVISKMGKGGAQRIVLDLANGLVAQGASVDLLIFFRTPQDATLLAELDSRVHLLNAFEISLLSDHQKQFIKVLMVMALPLLVLWWCVQGRLKKYQIVHSHLLLASFFSWLSYTFQKLFHWLGPKYVETFHADLIALSKWEQAFYWFFWKKRDAVVTELRRKDFQIVKKRLSYVLVKYIPFGIFPLNRPTDDQMLRYKEQYGIGSAPVILSITRLNNQEKRVRELLDVIASFRQIYTGEFIYLIVGDGPDRVSIQETVKALGLGDIVSFTGYSDEISIPCALASVFLITGIEDLLGIAGLQAASLGVPIVSYQIDPTWQNEDPIFFNSNSISELAVELNRLLKDSRHYAESSKHSYNVVRSTFSVDQMILSYLTLYKGLTSDIVLSTSPS